MFEGKEQQEAAVAETPSPAPPQPKAAAAATTEQEGGEGQAEAKSEVKPTPKPKAKPKKKSQKNQEKAERVPNGSLPPGRFVRAAHLQNGSLSVFLELPLGPTLLHYITLFLKLISPIM